MSGLLRPPQQFLHKLARAAASGLIVVGSQYLIDLLEQATRAGATAGAVVGAAKSGALQQVLRSQHADILPHGRSAP